MSATDDDDSVSEFQKLPEPVEVGTRAFSAIEQKTLKPCRREEDEADQVK
jgi:hypothetical protein